MSEYDEIIDLKGKVSKKANYEFLDDTYENETETQTETKKEKDYITRNGKKYYKCEKSYVYKCEDGFYAYRIVHKESKTNTFVVKDIETKERFRTETQAYKAQQEHLFQLRKDKTFKNRKVSFDEVWNYIKDTSTKDIATIIRYDSIYTHHVKDEFGHKAIQDITYLEINTFLDNFYRKGTGKGSKQKGYSYSYTESVLKFFWLVFQTSFGLRAISADDLKIITDNVEMPKNEDDEENVRILTREELNKVYELIKDTDFLLPALISVYTGARPGEAFAVRFDDFDFINNTVSINKQIVEKKSGMLYIEDPKTFSRTVKVPPFLIQKARERYKKIEQAKKDHNTLYNMNLKRVVYDLKNGKKGVDFMYDDLVSIDTKGRYNHLSAFGYYTKIIKQEICLHENGKEDFSFYSFRKTALSNFASHNIPIGALMKITGHKKPDTLYKYYYSVENEFAQEKIIETVKAFDCLIEE